MTKISSVLSFSLLMLMSSVSVSLACKLHCTLVLQVHAVNGFLSCGKLQLPYTFIVVSYWHCLVLGLPFLNLLSISASKGAMEHGVSSKACELVYSIDYLYICRFWCPQKSPSHRGLRPNGVHEFSAPRF